MNLRAFTLIELMIVMMILGVGLMAITPSIANQAIGVDEKLVFFEELLQEHHERSIELGVPISFTGFKGSANILTYDGKRVTIPNADSVQKAIVNGYETMGEEYSVRIYPDKIVDHFMIVLKNGEAIESLPLMFKTRYGEYEED